MLCGKGRQMQIVSACAMAVFFNGGIETVLWVFVVC